MKALISKGKIAGRVRVPSSKSYSLRGLMCAALAKGKSELVHPLCSDDTQAALGVLQELGIDVHQRITSWQVFGGGFHEPETELFCGESATTLRFMMAICSLVPGKCRLTAGPSLSKRPVAPLVRALRQLGVKCSSHGDFAPVVIERGRLKGGTTELAGDISSQFVSALLLIAPFAEEGMTIKLTTPLESKPYVMMTLDSMEKFGIKAEYSKSLDEFQVARQTYKPTRYVIEGDWSSASYLLALGAIAGEVEVENLDQQSQQGDKMMLQFLKEMGAEIRTGRSLLAVKKTKLQPIHADLSDCIDLLPTVAVLAALADGTSELTGIERARLKESNRVAAVGEGLKKMGIKMSEEKNKLTITGSDPKGATIDSRNDHRIAMAFSIMGTAAGDTVIEDAECVTKTFPEFWEVLKNLGGKVEIDGR